MDDEIISVNIADYHNLVHYYNSHDLNAKKEYETLFEIIKKLKTVISRVELLYHKRQIGDFRENILPIIAGSKPKDFTEFGILVNTGETEIVDRIIDDYIFNTTLGRTSSLTPSDSTYFNDQSKYVKLRLVSLPLPPGTVYGSFPSRLDKDLTATDKISVTSPVRIACRNGYVKMLGVLFRICDRGELVQEFLEPSLSELTKVEHLKMYDFVKKMYPSNDFPHYPCGIVACNNAIEISVVFAYVIDYFDLFKYFIELEGEPKICDEYVWGYLVYLSLDNDNMKMFCYFVQVGLYIYNLHLKYIIQSKSTNIGFYRNTLLEMVYLTGVHIGLEQLLILTDEDSENKLHHYLYDPTSLLNLCRMCLRKYFRLILPRNSSIFRIINKLDIPDYMISFLKMEDFIQKHFNY